MDIEVGAILDRAERHLGTKVVRLLIWAMYFAAFAFCFHIIRILIIAPMLEFFRTPLWGSALIDFALLAVGVGCGIFMASRAVASFAGWRLANRARLALDEANGLRTVLSSSYRRYIAEARDLNVETRAIAARALETFEIVIAFGEQLANESSPPDQEKRQHFREHLKAAKFEIEAARQIQKRALSDDHS